ncbi:hypothetical protein DL240_10405 [Lujinxingia litoralis]|uniref:Fatty acid transporter n=1 Tax=Lujinxingia litoralis TaxID=2211119 RepID=A0A328C5G7_9DELT|nr:outer membrane protein transport protein [Lujinxingia litoralis]RAL22256.1 hypothetical protein DL240_10405 [Lujinxingia litoralis]
MRAREMVRRSVALALLLVVMGGAVEARAGGFSQGVQGGASAGVAGALTARPDVPEAGYYNPAGFVLGRGWAVELGAGAIFPTLFHVDPRTGERTRAENELALVPHLHARARLGKRWGVGLSVGIPYASSLRWPAGWEGQAEAGALSLRAWEVAPSLAFRPTRWLALAAGPRLLRAGVGLERAVDVAENPQQAQMTLKAGAFGLGAQVGLWANPWRSLNLGLSWRSAVRLNMEGPAELAHLSPELAAELGDTRASTSLGLPDRLVLGLAWELSAQGIVSLDLEYQRWSSHEHFEVDFDDARVADLSESRDWRDTITMRLGLEYGSPVNGLTLRSGFAIDPSPAPPGALSPAQPETDRYIASLGLAYDVAERLRVNLAYNYVILSQTSAGTEAYPGIYDGFSHVLVLSVRAK